MHDLDLLFATAKAQDAAAGPSDGLMARVLADAAREQPHPAARPAARPDTAPLLSNPQAGFWPALAAVFGGGGVVAGLGTAAVAGLYLGFAPPAAMVQLTAAVIGTTSLESVNLMPGVDALLSEELEDER